MKGKIIKGIAGFYYVNTEKSGIYECKAKGIFRNRKIKPLVGDNVEIDIISETEKEGTVIQVSERKNELIRPAVANIDQALLIFAAAKPKPDFYLLDRYLVQMKYQQIPVVICFNKSDLIGEKEQEEMALIYRDSGFPVLFTSTFEKTGMEELLSLLKGKTSVASGPSGVGKSSIVNFLQNEIQMETGEISKKIERGKNTTRHSQLIAIGGDAYLMDTPGFGSFDLSGLFAADLWKYYEEFLPYESLCRFQGCSHIHEPDCGIKQALLEGNIHSKRYESYVSIYHDLQQQEKMEWRKP